MRGSTTAVAPYKQPYQHPTNLLLRFAFANFEQRAHKANNKKEGQRTTTMDDQRQERGQTNEGKSEGR
jgi:hypothetical protein